LRRIKNINQNEELETLNNQILDDFINKKTKLYIDNRLYLKRMLLSNYKKSFEVVNKIIDNKNIQKFICNIEKNIKLIGITNTGKVFNIDWESNINKDYKLDNKILGNIHPSEIINFHSIKKETRNYLCILNSDGRFKKVLFDEDMVKSNRSFTITKLKNNLKAIDSFISSPAIRTDSLNTVPPKLNTATSVVPPPISTIIVPIGSVTGNDAPIAAATGSSIKWTSLAPANPASLTALRSTLVTPLGIPITILGATIPLPSLHFWINVLIICSAASKSAITPSLSGLTALILPGVLPSINFASLPTANGIPSSKSIATTEGSCKTTPLPDTWIRVLAVP